MTTTTIAHPKIVSREQWLVARKKLLLQEKGLTRRRDALNANRRRLPMVKIDKNYVFEGTEGNVSLLDLFEGRNQLIVYHFMFDPGWEEGCRGCSFFVDNIGHLAHLRAGDTALVLVSRAPIGKLKAFKKRMGWDLPWYSSYGSDFNYDFHVTLDEDHAPIEYNYKNEETLEREGRRDHMDGEQPGLSAFLRLEDEVFHTYSTYGRGLDHLLTTYSLLDLTAYGRQQDFEDSPEGWPQIPTYPGWIRHHDKYAELSGNTECYCHSDNGRS